MSLFRSLGQIRKSFILAVIALALATQGVAQQQNAPAPNVQDGSASIIIVLDNSSAARGNFDALRNAARRFADSFGTRDELALYLTADTATLAQDFTGDISLIQHQLSRQKPKGKLMLFETLSEAIDHARSDSANERIAVVAFLSDLDSATARRAAALENKIRQKSGAQFYIVSYGKHDWKAQELAQRVAVVSGGAAYFPAKGSEVTDVAQSIAKKFGANRNNESAGEKKDGLPSLQNYKVVLVHDIPVASGDDTAGLPGGNNLLLHNVLVARLQKSKLFGEVRDATGTDETVATGPAANTNAPQRGTSELELLPMVVSYRGGIHSPKDLVAPFASPRLKVQVIMRDHNTHEAIGAFTEEASGAKGLLHGSDEKVQAQAIISVADKIISQLKELKKADKRHPEVAAE
jgi:Mg-chelatase subunit ChlD